MDSDENGWATIPDSCSVHGTVKQLLWGAGALRNPLLAVNCITNVFILHQQPMCAVHNDGVSVCQTTPTQLVIEFNGTTQILKTDIQVRVVAVNKKYIIISSGRQVAVYSLESDGLSSTTVIGTFSCDTERILIHKNTIVILTPTNIQMRTMEGKIYFLISQYYSIQSLKKLIYFIVTLRHFDSHLATDTRGR